MRKFTLILLAFVLCLSAFLAGCGCGKKDDFSMPSAQSQIDHAIAIKDAMFSGGTQVESALADAVTIEVVDEQDSQVTVALTAPQIYDRIAQWYGLTPQEGRTQQALEQEVYIAVEEAVQNEEFETIEIVIEIVDMPDTGPTYIIPDEALDHASGGMDRFFDNYDYEYPPCGFVDLADVHTLDIATIEHQILIQTLETKYYDMLSYRQVDIDNDGTKELVMFMDDPGLYLPGGTHMTFDSDTDALWCYSSLGAAESAGFVLMDGQWMFMDNYASAGNQMTDYRSWADYDGWVSECFYQAEYDDIIGNIRINECTWFGSDVTADEFFCHTPVAITYDNPNLHVQYATGSYSQMVEDLDTYLTESYYHDVYAMERADVNGDGMEDCIFVTGGTYEKRILSMNVENVWGQEPFFDVSDDQYIYTVIALVQTDTGVAASVSRVWPSGTYDPNMMENFHVSDDGALMFGQTRYIYDNNYHYFGEDIDLSGMEQAEEINKHDGHITLLDFLEMPMSEAEIYLENFNYFEAGFIEGYFQGDPLSMLINNNNQISSITVAQSGLLDIDPNTTMSMTAAGLWENIDHTDTPWTPIELIQNDYGTRVYYTHPQSGNRYTIDLFFDSPGTDANLIRIDIWPEF